jgi:CBS domain-containing protein
MRVGDICIRKVIHVRADESVRQAANTMRRRHVGSLVVVEQREAQLVPVGMITDRDIVIQVVAAGIDSEKTTVGDVMSRQVETCTENEYLFDAIQIMRQRGVRRLPVLDSQGGLIGVITVDDIYGAVGNHMSELTRTLTREQAKEAETRV